MKYLSEATDRAQASGLFPSADIDFPCEIGDDTKIWRNAHVSRDATIGSNCMIGEGVHVGVGVKIGNGCRIQNGAQLFEGVTIEENVFVGPHVVFTNVRLPRAFSKRARAFDLTTVKRGVSIGANATILCGIEIGEFAMVGAGSVATRNVAPYNVVIGNPAKLYKYVCACGSFIRPTITSAPTIDPITCGACQSVYSFSHAAGIRAKTST